MTSNPPRRSWRIGTAQALQVGVPVALLLAWEAMVRIGLVSGAFFPPPSRLVGQAHLLVDADAIGPDTLATIRRLALVALTGGVVGTVFGYLMFRMRSVDAVLRDPLMFVYGIPSLILFPLMTFPLGRTDAAVVAAAAITPVIVMSMTTTSALAQISPTHLEAARNFGAKGWRLTARVVAPAVLPPLATGFRVAMSLALIGLVSIEMVGAQRGLGAFMWQNWALLRVTELYLALAAIAVLGLTVSVGMDALFRRAMPWAYRQGQP